MLKNLYRYFTYKKLFRDKLKIYKIIKEKLERLPLINSFLKEFARLYLFDSITC